MYSSSPRFHTPGGGAASAAAAAVPSPMMIDYVAIGILVHLNGTCSDHTVLLQVINKNNLRFA